MWRINLVLLATAYVCSGASVAEVEQRNQRFYGSMTTYHVLTWGRITDGSGVLEVKNTPDGMATLDFLDGTQEVAFVFHGRDDTAFSEFGHTLRTYLLDKHRTMAVVLVDWSSASRLGYDLASSALPSVAEDVATFIAAMETAQRLNRALLHLIGFDLGAHLAGMTSRYATARAQKITALDPAGPGWDIFSRRLTATDAPTVEVIHTDGVGTRAYGIGEAIGTLDFFVNGGTRQPGCSNSDNLCHHNRAWQLFGASVDQGGHLYGYRCATLTEMNNNRCVGHPTATLGTNELFKAAFGVYRVNTGRTYPYNL